MDRVAGINYLEAGRKYRMPIKCHTSLVYPGETVPMIIDDSMHECLLNDGTTGMSFGLVFHGIWEHTKPNCYGVTCQIFEKGVADSNGNIRIKTKIYQRFVIYPTDTKEQPTFLRHRSITYVSCDILPDIYLPGPLSGLHLQSLNKFRSCDSMKNKLRNFESMSTVWPSFVYDMYDVDNAIQKIKQFLTSLEISKIL